MKAGKKTKKTDLPQLRRSLGRAGLFVEILTEKIGQIKSTNGRFVLQRTEKDAIVVCGDEKISLCENNLDLLLDRGEGEYITGSLFVVMK
ncbi:MAG: hypothetical protein WC788_08690 [Candidatus Paceibacterota bacterium]|jgi:hypothetical protein